MFSINLDVRAFTKSILEARKRFAHRVLVAVHRAAEIARDHAKESNLFEDKTGSLRRSIHIRLEGNDATVATNSPHAEWIERGNGFRHPGSEWIYPRHAPMLVFDYRGGHWVKPRVHVSAPRPFMAQARHHAVPFFQDLCEDAVTHMFDD